MSRALVGGALGVAGEEDVFVLVVKRQGWVGQFHEIH